MSDELHLKENPTLRDFQEYVAAIRKVEKIHADKNSERFEVESEAADTFMLLLDIYNMLGIDLEKAFREKEEVNKKRTWQ